MEEEGVHTPEAPQGLSSVEVAERVARGQTNAAGERTSRTYGDILRENVLTLFNLILTVLAIAVLIAGSPRDALFFLVVVFNAAVGVVQEVRAKRTLDRLTLLSAPRARVLRDGAVREIPLDEVVLDDVVLVRAGDQVPADGDVLDASGLEADESVLTGESVPVRKQPGDALLSGSVVVAGEGRFVATAVGEASYARKLSAEAKRFRLVTSELRRSIDRILTWVLWAMLPIGVLTVVGQIGVHAGWRSATLSTVAALEAMVPQGLVLLTSIAFAVSVIELGRRNVLVQELAAVEVLARVDVVCVDKTGTLTEASLAVDEVVPLGTRPAEGGAAGKQPVPASIAEPLGALAALAPNKTAEAIAERYPAPSGWTPREAVAFSSARKWSGADFRERGSWVLGAPEVLLADGSQPDAGERAAKLAAEGHRVLLLARAPETPSAERAPAGVTPAALVVLDEKVRADAPDTLAYFRDQGVTVKVISGDDPRTVGAIAAKVGLDPGEPVDARTLPSDETALAEAMDAHTVFGRVTPEQKRRMVAGLRARGHVVAMTGDGVNDVPALKTADLGIAMGSGAAATRAVAQVVLLDGRFATLPRVVAEGRRVIGNIERVANLFLTKTTYAVLLALAIAALTLPFPFLPRHLTVVAALTIGIPGFFLALEPNVQRYRPGFLSRVARFVVPAGVACAAASIAAYLATGPREPSARTAATIALTLVGLWVLGLLARPLRSWRAGLLAAMAAGLVLVLAVPLSRAFFALVVPSPTVLAIALASAAGGVVVLSVGLVVSGWRKAVAVP